MSLPKIFFQLNLNMKFWSGTIICVCSLLIATHCQTSQPDCELTECTQCLKNISKIFIHCNKTCHCLDSTANVSHVCNNETESSDFHTTDATQSCDIFFFNISSLNATEVATNTSSNETIPSATPTTLAPNVSNSSETTTIGPTTLSTSTTSAPNTTATAMTNVTSAVTNATTETITTVLISVSTEASSTLKPTEETGKPESSSTSKPEVVEDGRHFDGASFIGGMILAIGLMAISYVGLKFYRSRTENNYHTLREAIHM